MILRQTVGAIDRRFIRPMDLGHTVFQLAKTDKKNHETPMWVLCKLIFVILRALFKKNLPFMILWFGQIEFSQPCLGCTMDCGDEPQLESPVLAS